MTLESISRYIDKSCTVFNNSVCKLLSENDLNKVVKIHLKRENNPLDIEIRFIISREFISNGTLITKVTASYIWWVGRGFWSTELTGIATEPFKDYRSLLEFVSTKLSGFRVKLLNDIYSTGLRSKSKMIHD